MRNRKNKSLNYKFKCVNYSDYEIILRTVIDPGLMLYVFKKSKEKLARSKGISVKGDPTEIEVINVTPEYYNLLKTILGKVIKQIYREVGADKIVILNHIIRSARFVKAEGGDYVFTCEVVGQYADKR